jgi:hypothetical protein
MSEAGLGTTAEADSVDMTIKTGVNTVMDALTTEIRYEQQLDLVQKLSMEEYFMNLSEQDQLDLAIQASMETSQDDGFTHQFDGMMF